MYIFKYSFCPNIRPASSATMSELDWTSYKHLGVRTVTHAQRRQGFFLRVVTIEYSNVICKKIIRFM